MIQFNKSIDFLIKKHQIEILQKKILTKCIKITNNETKWNRLKNK